MPPEDGVPGGPFRGMLFNSIQFLIFFPVVAVLYFLSVHRLRSNWMAQAVLLAASLVFYMSWNPAYLLLILMSVVITWTSGLLMEGRSRGRKRAVLAFSLVSNLAILFVFKYYNFFAESMDWISHRFSLPLHIRGLDLLLPVGISFYTFQALGYSMDVYRDQVKVERNLLTYALFVTFFPQLVAGPIERTAHLLPQFKANHEFDYDRVADGLILAAWGMFKKVVIADRLAVYVDAVYGNLSGYCGIAVALATFFFAFQILCDFSGYSDIAIGVARILGFNLMTNFRSPYFARSIGEFWRRWHISLSTWFRDYFYIALGGNRVATGRRYMNLFLTFLVSGIWHGAAWTFVIWGALHGLMMIVGVATRGMRDRLWGRVARGRFGILHAAVQMAFTFLAVYVTWIFFRANSLADALQALRGVAAAPGEAVRIVRMLMAGLSPWGGEFHILTPAFSLQDIGLGLGLVGVLLSVDFLQFRNWGLARLRSLPVPVRWPVYYLLVMGILLLGMFGKAEFIYFQF